MSFVRRLGICALLALFTQCAFATVSLIVPGINSQPLSAVELGVDNSGHTTWEILPGLPVETSTPQPVHFIGTAILVEGSTDAHIHEVLSDPAGGPSVTVDITCAITNGIASCAGDQGFNSTPFPIGTQGPAFAVQAVTASATPSPSAPASANSALVTPRPSGSASGSAAGASAPTTSSASGASSSKASTVGFAGVVGILSAFVLFH